MKEKINNWTAHGDGFIFTFAKDREAIGVKVNFEKGTIGEDEVAKLHDISDKIINKGLASLDILPGQLKAITLDDYLSDQYTHPADNMAEQIKEFGLTEKTVDKI